ncbi:MAG: OsmC family protein, partial [Sedimentibacter sp.]
MYKTNISAKLKGKMAFEMNIDGHTVITDTSVLNGGNNFGPGPKSLLLAGIIGCSGIDIMHILKGMEIVVEDVNVDIEAETRNEDPKIYNYINIIYKFKGKDLILEKLEE